MAWLSLLFLVVAAVLAFGLTGYGFGRLARTGPLPDTLRGLGALAGAAAVGLYAWGLLHVVGAVLTAEDGGTDSAPPQSCRTAGWWERYESGIVIVDYTVTFVPLGFVCETSDGGSYDNGDVPGYVNPGTLALGLTGVGGVIGAGFVEERRARAGDGRAGSRG
ncbi:hypothetical protein ACIPSE_05765 [Streptomyces sp. NPDC090106]|uniref:hypothetical protein n=1 Tax=Streptomyces sp. NPDC090106 TaxID=3365946 RepID=UPI00380CBB26